MNGLTKEERNWVVYDVGNSAFTLLVSTIMPIYFSTLAEAQNITSVDYLAYWGYATSISTLLVALSGPVLGTMTDREGRKKPFFTAAVLIGCVLCMLMGFTSQWLLFLIVYIGAKAAYSSSLIFYDSMLIDVTEEDRVDSVSSQGYAWGYIGSCIPFIVSLIIYLFGPRMGLSTGLSLGLSFIITALWWFLFTIPLLKTYRQKHFNKNNTGSVSSAFRQLGQTLKNAMHHKKILFFLLAFFFYIDGVYTIIDMATTYGKALGLNTTGLLLALLVTQFVAFPSAIAFGRFSKKYDSVRLITICITAYLCCAIFAFFLQYQWQFWVLAVVIGMFQGGIQALSRSYYTKIIPADQSGEYFGLLDICGKGAAFLGTIVVSAASQLTGSVNVGVGSIAVFFLIGIVLFRKAASVSA
jgi:UMF1 family MFS transporter